MIRPTESGPLEVRGLQPVLNPASLAASVRFRARFERDSIVASLNPNQKPDNDLPGSCAPERAVRIIRAGKPMDRYSACTLTRSLGLDVALVCSVRGFAVEADQ